MKNPVQINPDRGNAIFWNQGKANLLTRPSVIQPHCPSRIQLPAQFFDRCDPACEIRFGDVAFENRRYSRSFFNHHIGIMVMQFQQVDIPNHNAIAIELFPSTAADFTTIEPERGHQQPGRISNRLQLFIRNHGRRLTERVVKATEDFFSMAHNSSLRLSQHFSRIIRIKAMLHQFSNMALPALFAAAASATSPFGPNRHKLAHRLMQPVMIGMESGANFRRLVQLIKRNFRRYDFSLPKFKAIHGGNELFVPAQRLPVFATKAGGKLGLLIGGGIFGREDDNFIFHTQFWFLVSSNRLVGSFNDWLTTQFSHFGAKMQFQNQPRFINA